MMNKADRKRMIQEYKKREAEKFVESLPLAKDIFESLFDYLDEKLSEYDCQEDFTFTVEFLEKHDCDIEQVLEWLVENGGGCDCEVLDNVEERFEEYF